MRYGYKRKDNPRYQRGGSWRYSGSFCRVEDFDREVASKKGSDLGFRIVRTISK